jgi:hypothetical protein
MMVFGVSANVASEPASFDLQPVLLVVALVAGLTVASFGARVWFDGITTRSNVAAWLAYQPLPHRNPSKLRRQLVALDLAIVAILTLVASYVARAFVALPPGYDTWGHLAKIRLMEADWPHVNWNPHWYGGAPYFQGSYPPGYHGAVLLVARLGLGVGASMTAVNLFGLAVITTMCYLAAYWATSSRASGWIAAGFIASCGLLWFHLLGAGIQPRTFGLAGFALALAGVAGVLNRGEHVHTAITATGIAWAMFSHLMVGLISAVLVAIVLVVGQLRVHPAVRILVAFRPLALGGLLSAFMVLPLPFFIPTGSQQSVAYTAAPLGSLLGQRVFRTGLALDSQPVGLPSGLLAAVLGLGLPLAALAFNRRRRRLHSRAIVQQSMTSRPHRFREIRPSMGFSFAGAASVRVPALPGRMPTPPRLARPRWHSTTWGLLAALPPCAMYAFLGHFTDSNYFVNGLLPIDILVYPVVLLCVLAGVLTFGLASDSSVGPRWRAAGIGYSALCVGLSWLVIGPALSGYGIVNGGQEQVASLVLPEQLGSTDLNQRIAAGDDTITRPLNALTVAPQVRGYQANAIVDLDWQYVAEVGTNSELISPAQRAATGQWWGLTSYYVLSDSPVAEALAEEPERYEPLGEVASGYSVFRQTDVAGVVTPVRAPTILVVGSDVTYRTWFNALLGDGVGPDRAVLVKGPGHPSDLSEADLSNIDSVIVDGVAIDSTDRLNALDAWVNNGGRLFVESANSGVEAAESLPSPMPVAGFESKVVRGIWDFRFGAPQPVEPWTQRGTQEFGLPSWSGRAAWEVKKATELKPWSTVALSAGDSPIIVVGRLGAGTVTWSGMNLAFHASLQFEGNEKQFVARLVGVADESEAVSPGAFEPEVKSSSISAINPPGSSGVLVRQNLNGNWRASVDGRSVRILEAGPGFMFVPTDQPGAVVKLWYATSLVERLGWWVTLIALAVTLTMLLHPVVFRLWARRSN